MFDISELKTKKLLCILTLVNLPYINYQKITNLARYHLNILMIATK